MKKTVESRFEILKDGWIKNLETGMEYGPSSTERMNKKQAKAWCKKMGGHLPAKRKDLEDIQDLTRFNPCCDPIFKDMQSGYYWTNEPCAFDKSSSWCVSFFSGGVSYCSESLITYVRPVRASQC